MNESECVYMVRRKFGLHAAQTFNQTVHEHPEKDTDDLYNEFVTENSPQGDSRETPSTP